MDIQIENGDHAVDGRGLPMRIQGAAKQAQSAMIRLAVRRGSFVPDKTLGSLLHTLPGADNALAQSYVQDALSGMPGVRVHEVRCAYGSAENTLSVHVELGIDGERYTAQVNV